jgi:hypothetical protein
MPALRTDLSTLPAYARLILDELAHTGHLWWRYVREQALRDDTCWVEVRLLEQQLNDALRRSDTAGLATLDTTTLPFQVGVLRSSGELHKLPENSAVVSDLLFTVELLERWLSPEAFIRRLVIALAATWRKESVTYDTATHRFRPPITSYDKADALYRHIAREAPTRIVADFRDAYYVWPSAPQSHSCMPASKRCHRLPPSCQPRNFETMTAVKTVCRVIFGTARRHRPRHGSLQACSSLSSNSPMPKLSQRRCATAISPIDKRTLDTTKTPATEPHRGSGRGSSACVIMI